MNMNLQQYLTMGIANDSSYIICYEKIKTTLHVIYSGVMLVRGLSTSPGEREKPRMSLNLELEY